MATSTQQMIAAVQAALQSTLPDLVSAAGLPAVTNVLDYDPPVATATKTPLVWIDEPSDERSSDPTRGATIGRSGKYSHRPTLLVGVQAAGADASRTVGSLRAYADLIRQSLDNATLEGQVWVLWLRTDYSPSFREGNGLFKEAVLTFDVNRRTVRGAD